MTARRKNGQMSNEELELRRFHRSLKRIKKWCKDQDVEIHSYSEASSDEVCVTSRDEYEVSSRRDYLIEDNESYFVSEEDYEAVSNELLYL